MTRRTIPLSALPASVRAKLQPARGTTTETAKAIARAKADLARETFFAALDRAKLPRPVTEHRFDAERQWRFDYAWPDDRVALEVEGGAFVRGRHTSGAGFRADLAKYNAALAQGWRVVRVLPEQLATLPTIQVLACVLTRETAK